MHAHGYGRPRPGQQRLGVVADVVGSFEASTIVGFALQRHTAPESPALWRALWAHWFVVASYMGEIRELERQVVGRT